MSAQPTKGAAARRLPIAVLGATILLIGLVMMGQGLWIHAKAALAQLLLERAFAQSVETHCLTVPASIGPMPPSIR